MRLGVLYQKRIVLGVTGSIACYKSLDLASKLTQLGADVDVVMTDAAQRFVQPLSFQSVTGRAVYGDLWAADHVRHVQLGETADLLIIAPATAQTIAKLALGLADNLLTVTALAARCPLLIAPAMDGGMYSHPATQANVQTLVARGATIIGPTEGRMASGLEGTGRLVEPAILLQHVRLHLGRSGPLRGRRVVVTAGPTLEPIDPVRFISNHSSGKQGLALAEAALDAGAEVTLITGPLRLPLPLGASHVPVKTARQMCDAVLVHASTADVLIMAAAVADFRPASSAAQKIKKTDVGLADSPRIELARNPDILLAVKEARAASGFPRVVLGFAAETNDVLAYGRDKLRRKGLDLIAINDVSREDAGFGVDENHVLLLEKGGRVHNLPLQSKTDVAEQIVGHLARLLQETKDSEPSV